MSSSSWPYRMALLVLACIAILPYVSAAAEYCSDINTSSNSRNSSLFQSNGLCSDFCRADYAFAIVQDEGCWCSNYAPGTTEDGCTQTCPGYPLELCGGSGVYGYLALVNAVSGTIGATSSSTTTTEEATSTTEAAAAQVTVTEVAQPTTIIPDPLTVYVTPSQPSTTSTTSETTAAPATTSTTPTTTSKTTTSSTTSSPTSTWTPTPVTSLETVAGTSGGSMTVRTVTVTPTVPPTASSTATVSKSSGSGGFGTGAAVGLTIGLVALVAILSSIGYFCWRRRQKEKNAEYNDVSARQSGSGFAPVVPSRTMSESSRYVLNTDGVRVVESWEDGAIGGKGRSNMTTVDQRLDPFSRVYQRPADSKSRDSVNTIHDDHDYSRRVMKGPLRTTNPDPDMTNS